LNEIVSQGIEDVQTGESMAVSISQPKSLLSNATWSLLATVWFTVASFFLTPFLIAHLGTDYYGLWILIMAISGMMGIMDLGLGEATVRYVAYYYGRGDMGGINRAVGATLSIYLVTGLLGWAVLFYGSPWFASLLAIPPEDLDLAASLLRLTAVNFGLMIASGAYGAIPKALQRYDIDTKIMIAQSVFQLAGTVTIVLAGLGVYELVLWSLVATVIRQFVNVLVAKHLIPSLRLSPSPSRAGLREVFSYGFFASLTQGLSTVAGHADRLLLGALISASAVAHLSVPKNLVLRGTNAVSTAGAALFPRFSAIGDDQAARRLFLHATWSMLCATIVLFVPMTVLLPDFLCLWVGPEFAQQSARAGQIFAFSCILRGAFMPAHRLFQGKGKPQYITAWYLGSSLTNLGLNLLLIPAFGLVGAAYTYVFMLFWGILALLFAWRQVLRSASWRFLVRAVVLPIALGLVGLALAFTVRSAVPSPGWLGLILLGAAFVIGTAALVVGVEWLLGGRGSHAGILLRALFSLLQSGPWVRWLRASSAEHL
jgi:O-antigen/teichoic acid export membrane protein